MQSAKLKFWSENIFNGALKLSVFRKRCDNFKVINGYFKLTSGHFKMVKDQRPLSNAHRPL